MPNRGKEKRVSYLGVGITLGVAIGAAFGIIAFDNLLWGIGPGIALGIAIALAMSSRQSK